LESEGQQQNLSLRLHDGLQPAPDGGSSRGPGDRHAAAYATEKRFGRWTVKEKTLYDRTVQPCAALAFVGGDRNYTVFVWFVVNTNERILPCGALSRFLRGWEDGMCVRIVYSSHLLRLRVCQSSIQISSIVFWSVVILYGAL
jgi:hypothetical protein